MSAPDSSKIDLLACSPHGGCSAKLSPKDLEALVGQLPAFAHPDLLVGVETHDDAAAFRISEDKALIFTTDFFPPVCSDAETFGRIAAANALSDVYAMGGEPLLALNVVGFSPKELPFETYAAILRGSAEKVAEAGALLVGGHTIDDHPPKYGLAVVGLARPDRLIANAGARPGQRLLLTKPLGTGVLCAAHRLGLGRPDDYERALARMRELNRNPSRAAVAAGVRGGTDVTGFGLAGHALKLARASGVALTVEASKVPALPGARELLDLGCAPGALFRNLDFVAKQTLFSETLSPSDKLLVCDAQTSGGLLLCVDPDKADGLLSEIRKGGFGEAAEIGTVDEAREGEPLLRFV